jgi:cobalt-zinc-cadmium efflux system membrane fusion protein
MSVLETKTPEPGTSQEASQNGPPSGPAPRARRSGGGKLVAFLLIAALAAGGIYAYAVGTAKVRHELDQTFSYVSKLIPSGSESPPSAVSRPAEPVSQPTWDGNVRIDSADAHAIGLLVVAVAPQSQPIKLDLAGSTDYDPNTLSKIRPRFDTLVEKVHIELGQKVQKGDPLVDLFSTDLASAKNDLQTKYVQWQHDRRLLDLREKLFETKAIAEQVLVDTRNDESKSRLDYNTAREKLRVFEVPETEIDLLIRNLKTLRDLPDAKDAQNVIDKARMTRRSPIDGIVITKDVVVGNLYDNNDILMVIAPLEHLFVWVNVYEAEQAKLAVGQRLEIKFPYMKETIDATVQYVAPEVSKDTHAIRIRASVPNVSGMLRANMLARAALEIPPVKGQTVIPRASMVVMNGHDYAFVRKPPTHSKDDERFERRDIVVAEERADHVVVKSGLTAGEEVASSGSLILAQLYEEQQMVATGMPLK